MVTGRCLCGGVTWRARSWPATRRSWWPRLCEAIGARSAMVEACFRTADVEIEGELAGHEGAADNGARLRRRFCPRCGVYLFSQAEPRPHLIFIRVGTMDDREAVRPEMTLRTRIAQDIPSLEAQAPPAA